MTKLTKQTMYIYAGLTLFMVIVTTAMGAFDLTVQKWVALGCLVLTLVLPFHKNAKNLFNSRTTPLFMVMLGYVIWNGVSMFYADVPKAALFEFTKLIGAFAAFLLVLFVTQSGKRGFKLTASVLTVTTAVLGIISIDAASSGPIATAFKAFMGMFTTSMYGFGFFENGVRITGIFGNANTFSGLMALGVLLSLALVLNIEEKRARAFSIAVLAVNSLSYILLFSLGSMFMFLVACILMIALSNKGEKLKTFILMFETAIITLIFTGVALITMGTSPLLPLAAILLNSVVLWAFDAYVSQGIIRKLASNTKGGMIGGIVAIVLLVAYVIAALNVTGPLTLAPSETVMRGAYLDPGAYTLSSTWKSSAANPTVRITTQNMTDLKVHTSSELYSGSIDTVAFTVPEDSEIVKIYFTGGVEGSTIELAACLDASDNSSKSEIKLDYKLLPAIAANRIQDLRANENSVQRVVFFEDGMKLFKQSPIIGHGLSGYETGVASVQNFFYETRYVHNHYIQALCDLGIIGLALFLGILVCCVLPLVSLFKRSKQEGYKNGGAFALPVMAALMFQIFGQAITDLTWSAGPFLVIAFGVIALLIVVTSKDFGDCDESGVCEVSEAKAAVLGGKTAGKNLITGAMISRILVIAAALVMTVLLSLNLYANHKAASGNCPMAQMASLSKLDKFEGDDYKISYIVAASINNLEENYAQADKFATELTSNSDAVLNYLLPYYFNTAQDEKLFDTASIATDAGKASPYIWNEMFATFDSAINTNRDDPMPILLHLFGNKEYYIEGLLGYYKDLQDRNETYLDDAMLDASNVVFIGKLLGIENLDTSHLVESLDVFVKTIFDSKFAVDADKDGIPDNVTVSSGSTAWGQTTKVSGSGFDGTMKAEAGTVMELEAYCVRGGEYTFRLAGLTGLDGAAAPKDLTATVDGQSATVQYDENGAFVKVNLRGAVAADDTKNIKESAASTEKIMISLPTGGIAGEVSLKR